jgi:ankyrin repeat protein
MVAGGQPRTPDPDGARTIEAMQLLLARGVDIDAFNTTGQTAIHAAAGRGVDPVVKFLAEKGATLNLPDKQGRTPLDVALGVGSGGGRAGRVASITVRESTAALLRQLMAGRSASR